MRNLALPLIAGAALSLSAAASQAQSVGIAIDTDGPAYGYTTYGGPRYDGYYGYRSAAPMHRHYGRSYGYRASEPVVVEERGTSGGCGTYFYWNGDRCVDARNK